MNRSTPIARRNQRRRYRPGMVMTVLTGLTVAVSASARAQENISIESLLKGGWQIAGYTAPGDNRSSFILFQHPDHTHLVNCRVGYDVNRKPRSYSNCYALR